MEDLRLRWVNYTNFPPIKTKLVVSLVVEVLIILFLTEFAYHKIEQFRKLNSLISVISDIEADFLKVELVLERRRMP